MNHYIELHDVLFVANTWGKFSCSNKFVNGKIRIKINAITEFAVYISYEENTFQRSQIKTRLLSKSLLTCDMREKNRNIYKPQTTGLFGSFYGKLADKSKQKNMH